jgi:Cu2+-exporting ATPase
MHPFCCYGCCLAYQVHHGVTDEPEAATLLIRLGAGGFLAMNIMLFSLLLYSGTFGPDDGWTVRMVHLVLWLLATLLVAILGGPFVQGAWQSLQQRRISADTLVSVAVLAAYGYSTFQVVAGTGAVYFDTATMVLVLFVVGRYLEARARVQAARSLAPMLAAERSAVRVRGADGNESLQPVLEVRAGSVVRVLPGERIPVDGLVIAGRSGCDEALLTGQPEPQMKSMNSAVHAGSINGNGQLLIRASADGANTRWMHISRFVRDALTRKAALDDTVDRVAAVFLPFVLLFAAGATAFWLARVPADQALMIGLAVLVVACPCSLGLAASLGTTLGIGMAANRGILIRGGHVLEDLARVRTIAFDKTGTLTEGRPRVQSIEIQQGDEREAMARLCSLASASDHPLARGIVEYALSLGVHPAPPSSARACPGAGMIGDVAGETTVLGSRSFVTGIGWSMPPTWHGHDEHDAGTEVFGGWAGGVEVRFTLDDKLLPEAADTLALLRKRGVALVLLSGDRQDVVARTAAALRIADWRAGLLPEDKVAALEALGNDRGPIAMVGDGLNDSPVLAAAAVGIAVGTAADLARESADIVLPTRALENLPWVLQLAARVRRSTYANIAWAFGYNGIALTLAATGLLQPAIAAALMAGSSVLVIARSVRNHRASLERAVGSDGVQGVPALPAST